MHLLISLDTEQNNRVGVTQERDPQQGDGVR